MQHRYLLFGSVFYEEQYNDQDKTLSERSHHAQAWATSQL